MYCPLEQVGVTVLVRVWTIDLIQSKAINVVNRSTKTPRNSRIKMMHELRGSAPLNHHQQRPSSSRHYIIFFSRGKLGTYNKIRIRALAYTGARKQQDCILVIIRRRLYEMILIYSWFGLMIQCFIKTLICDDNTSLQVQ
jgi:hypothetical protein